MKKIVLHVGSGKAGSTSIQQALLQSQEKNSGLYTYPVLPNTPGNQIIRHAFCKGNSSRNKIAGKNGFGEELSLDEYQEVIKLSFKYQCERSKNVIISSEFLFGSSEGEVKEFGVFLRDLGFYEIHAIIYLRDPASYYLSLAQQALKKQYKIPQPTNFKYEMIGAADRWLSISPASMTIREFSALSLQNGDIVRDFEEYLLRCGIAVSLNIDRRRNETLPCEIIQAMQDIHQYLSNSKFDGHVKAERLRKIRKLIREEKLKGTKPQLLCSIEDYIHKRFLSEIMELYSRYGIFKNLVNKPTNKKMDYNDLEQISLFRDIVQSFDVVLYEKIRSQYLEMVK